MVTCGEDANQLLGKVLNKDRLWFAPKEPMWCWQDVRVILGNHTSLRPRNNVSALKRFLDRAVRRELARSAAGELRER